jgi:hypothetical protein
MTPKQLCGALFVAAGLGVVGLSIRNALIAIASRRWLTTEGVVLASELQRSEEKSGTYTSQVSYRYSVDGKDYVAERARFGDHIGLGWSAPARRIVGRYPKGARVRVHYDPDKPADAVLEPGMTAYFVGEFVIGVGFMLCGFTPFL